MLIIALSVGLVLVTIAKSKYRPKPRRGATLIPIASLPRGKS